MLVSSNEQAYNVKISSILQGITDNVRDDNTVLYNKDVIFFLNPVFTLQICVVKL